jgi:hypothetical protein
MGETNIGEMWTAGAGERPSGVRCSRRIERYRHLFLHCLEFRRSPSSRARQVHGELPVDTARLTAHNNDPIRQCHGFLPT